MRVFDNLSTGSATNLDGTGADLVEGDVRDLGALLQAARGCHVVFHLAAGTGVQPSIEDPFADFDLNGRGTLSALWAAKEVGARAGSSSRRRMPPSGPEPIPASEDKPTAPLSPYGASKATGEAYCSAFSGAYGLETVRRAVSNALRASVGAQEKRDPTIHPPPARRLGARG